MSLDTRKSTLWDKQAENTQISLRIRAVLSLHKKYRFRRTFKVNIKNPEMNKRLLRFPSNFVFRICHKYLFLLSRLRYMLGNQSFAFTTLSLIILVHFGLFWN